MNDQGKLHQKMTFECRLAKISKAGDEVRSKDAVRVRSWKPVCGLCSDRDGKVLSRGVGRSDSFSRITLPVMRIDFKEEEQKQETSQQSTAVTEAQGDSGMD